MFHLTLVSSNAKTGPIPVSTSPMETCPDACPLKKGGCYGKGGPLLIHWRKVSEDLRGQLFGEFVSAIKKLPRGQLWRHNQVGDLVGENNVIDSQLLSQLVDGNKGRNGYTYTHKPVIAVESEDPTKHVSEELAKSNRDAIANANKNGFTINLSADNLQQADAKAALGIGPVVVIVDSKTKETVFTPEGRKVILCPATQKEGINYANCKLCQKQRSVIVGFPAHGNAVNKVNAIIAKL